MLSSSRASISAPAAAGVLRLKAGLLGNWTAGHTSVWTSVTCDQLFINNSHLIQSDGRGSPHTLGSHAPEDTHPPWYQSRLFLFSCTRNQGPGPPPEPPKECWLITVGVRKSAAFL